MSNVAERPRRSGDPTSGPALPPFVMRDVPRCRRSTEMRHLLRPSAQMFGLCLIYRLMACSLHSIKGGMGAVSPVGTKAIAHLSTWPRGMVSSDEHRERRVAMTLTLSTCL